MAGTFARLPDFLIVGQERWDDVERRNQLLIKVLAQRHTSSRFLFAEQPLRPREAASARAPFLRRVAPNVWVTRAVRPVPDRVSSDLADRAEAAQLRRGCARLGIESPWIWTQDPRAATLLALLPADGLVYDLTDDWAAFESDPARRARVQQRIDALTRRAELVLACSRPLERGARRLSSRVVYLPNAVEPVAPEDPAVPADLAAIPSPRLGYAGTLHAARVDVELLRAAASLRPDWSFVFLGPNMLDPDASARLFDLPNTIHVGTRPHDQVRAYLTGFDVCLLPNLVNAFTRSLDPLKLYEYLAAGRPVISTPVDNAPDLNEHIDVVTNAGELVTTAERLMGQDSPDRRTARQAAVAGETWEARAATIEATLDLPPAATRLGSVSAVVVSFNTRALTERCLTALRASSDVELQTIVVDNGSTDGSTEMVRERFPETELLELGENVGFGPANNAAFERCEGEFVLLVNSDAFVEPDTIATLTTVARRHPDAAVVGPRLLNPDGSLQRSAWPFPTATRMALEAFGAHRALNRLGLMEDLRTWPHDEEREVDFLIGACLLIRREALTEVGGFDEAFWLYAEEADLLRRMRARGWCVVFTPAAHATHVGSASSTVSADRLRNFYAGQLRFLGKHGRRGASAVGRLAILLGAALRGRWTTVRVGARLRRATGGG